jgi:hypothetical protein
VSFAKYLLKRGVVSGLVKQRESPNATIQDVIGEVSSSKAWAAWNGKFLPKAM